MGASSSEGTGHGSAEGPLRGFDLDKAYKIFQPNKLKSAINILKEADKVDKYLLNNLDASDINFDDDGLPISGDNVQEVIENILDNTEESIVVNSNVFTYKQGAVTSGNTFGTWEELYDAFQAVDGIITIYLDTSITSPLTIPAGTYDFEYRAILEGGPTADFGSPNALTTGAGVVIKNLNLFMGIMFWTHTGPDAVLEYDGADVNVFSQLTVIFFGAGGGPFVSVGAGQDLSWGMNLGVVVTGIAPFFELDSTASSITISARNGNFVMVNPLDGGGVGTSATIDFDNSNVQVPYDSATEFASFTGTGSLTIQRPGTYELDFVNADLSSDVLSVPHALDKKEVFFVISNGSDVVVDLSTVTITLTDRDNATIDFTGSTPLTGTYHLVVRK